MKQKPLLKYVSGLAVTCFLFGSAQAVVVLNDSFSAFGDGDDAPALANAGGGQSSYTFSSTFLSGFGASGSDKLVLGFANKDDNGANLAGPLISSVTYNGVSLTEAAQHASLRQRQGIFYLDNVTGDGDLVVTFNEDFATTEQATWALVLYALDGTAAGVSDTATGVHTATDLSAGGVPVTVTGSSAFVLNLWSRNNSDPALSGPAGFTADLDGNPGNSATMASVFASSIVTSAGSYTTSVTNVGGNTPAMTFTGAAFEAVPEPSVSLLGLGGLALLLRRRRPTS